MGVDGYVPLSSAWGEIFGELNVHEDALHRGKSDIFHQSRRRQERFGVTQPGIIDHCIDQL